MGYQDFYDTPDPYVNLVMRSSPEGRKSTTVKDDDPNPVWNESFTFYINFTQANVLEISLMESNYIFDQKVGTVWFDIVNINEMDKAQLETFVFNDVSQVDIEFKLEFDRNPTLRYSLCLSDAEKTFMERRKEKILEGLRKLLGEEEAPMNTDEVPTIAVIGSGGGFRAMTGYSGVIKALVDTGVFDCSMYACGLSGSSWLVSTLYSHPKWPNLDMSEFLDELKHSVDKSLLRFFNVSTMYNYAKFMVEKRREGQPVSFTDIFGRMVGETLLQGRMQTTLSDQREKIKDGAIPMPLYTCVHVKKDVPARSFQEWVEFSPYEIGLPKYGTFMDSELFGSKFFMGKLVKKFKEQPLHFLQGIWGSAFCILFKRLLEDNRRIDPVEMVRQEMGKQLDEAAQESSSDCSDNEVDDDDDEESSTESSMDSDTGSVRGLSSVEHDVSKNEDDMGSGSEKGKKTQQRETRAVSDTKNSSDGEVEMIMGRERSMSAQIDDENVDGDSAYEGEEGEDYDVDLDDDEDDNDLYQSAIQSPRGIMKKKGSLEKLRARKNQRSSKDSASPDNDIVQDQIEVPQFQSSSRLAAADLDKSSDLKKSVNWGACPTRGNKPNLTETQQRRQAYLRAGSSMRKSRTGSKSYWKKLMKGVFESNSWELLSTRRGRAAVIHNFMRGLSLERSYPLSPFTPIDERVKEGDEFDGIFEMHPTSVKHIYMVDAGLTFNSPYPLILRPQRGVDIILSFDFSARPSDSHQPFKELLLAEKWARLNRLPFPPIDTSVFDREGMKELYIFRHPTNPHCPIVLHFVLINKTFKYYKKPGIPRETKEEFDFAEFDVFDDPKAPYSTFNFTYEHRNFERLSQLMEFNTLLHIDDIKQVIKDVIKQRREGPPKVPIQSKDIKLLRMKSVQEMRKLRKYISRMESRSSLYSTNSPSTPFHTPAHTIESSTNPFFAGYHRELSLSLSSSSDSSIFGTPREKQSESVSRGSRSKKHIHPSQIFSESEEVRWQTTAPCDITENSSISPTCSSVESVFGTPPNSMHHFQNFEQIFPSDKPSSDVCLEPIDVCDGPVKETGVTNQSSAENSRERTNTLSMESAEHCDSALDSQTDGGLAETRPSLSPKVKIPDPSVTNVNNSDSSGFGSLGAVCGTDSSGTSSAGFSSTPGTGTSGKSSSGFSSHGSTGSLNQFMTKGKTRKESPPNPFFAKAFFMRSPNNSTSSTSSSSSLQSYAGSDIGNGKRVNPLRGNSYRLSPQTPSTLSSPETASGSSVPSRLNSHSQVLSPLAFTSGTKSSYSSQPQKGTSPETPDEYCLAPAAFRKDGTPVFDTVQAKMFYESVKDKRKIFRRQSTISSLNSISLDESGPSYDDQAEDDNSNSDKGLCSPVIPHKKPFIYSDTHFRDHFYSCVEDLGEDENTNKEQLITETAGMGNIPQNKPLATDYGVDFDIEDLSQFRGVDDTSLRQMDHWESSEPSESVDSNHEVIESQESDAQCVQSPI